MKLFLVKKLRIQKGNICFKKIYNCALDGLDTEPEQEPYLDKSWNRNRNFSKVGTGTVKKVTVPQHFHWSIRI